MTENEIRERVHVLHPDAVIDIAGTDNGFELHVVSDRFTGKNALERQRPIKAIFSGDLFSGRISTLSIQAYTPDECAFANTLDDTIWVDGQP
ncbi:MAG TPA: BolA/IbaG family iron-sulfur metabolism protein [Halothiobacillus sp.]|nr:BolA/IbaG family iron-sulfur metabolism protein [Halothiobacillus sp.]